MKKIKPTFKIPGYHKSLNDKKRDPQKEIEDLKGRIKASAFDPNGEMIRFELPSISFKEGPMPDMLDYFLMEYANILWELKKSMDRDEIESIIDEAEQENERRMNLTAEKLENTRWFSKTAIRSALVILSDDLSKHLEKAKHKSKDFHYEYQFDSNKHAWKDRLKTTINRLIELYNEYTPLKGNDYQISHNMVLVFEACNVMPDSKNLYELVKSYFRSIKKSPEKFSLKIRK